MGDDVKLEVVQDAATKPSVVASDGSVTVTDKRGRSITLRKPPFIAQFDLIDALGTSAENVTYRSMVTPLLFVVAIDGDPVVRPVNKAQLRALATRLDEHGFAAVAECIQANFSGEEGVVSEQSVKND